MEAKVAVVKNCYHQGRANLRMKLTQRKWSTEKEKEKWCLETLFDAWIKQCLKSNSSGFN